MINFFSADKNNLPLQVKINTEEIERLKASVKITPKGEYDAETIYKRFDVVVASDNNTYICNADAGVEIVGQDPTTSSYWTLYAMHGAKGDPGENGIDGTNGTDGVDGKDGNMFALYQASITNDPLHTYTLSQSNILNAYRPVKVKDLVMSVQNSVYGQVTAVDDVNNKFTLLVWGTLKGAQGDAGEYNAGEGITITEPILFQKQINNVARLKGTSAPTTATVGYVGQEYYNTNTGDIYTCKEVIDNGDDTYSYTWEISGGKPILDSKMENPMTSAGDLIYGGPSGTPTALPIGQPGQIPAVNQSGTGYEFVNQAGGGKLYSHTIKFNGVEDKFIIYSSSNTPFTISEIAQYLTNIGINGSSPLWTTSFYTVSNANKNVLIMRYGVYSIGNLLYLRGRNFTYTINGSDIEITATDSDFIRSSINSDTVVEL